MFLRRGCWWNHHVYQLDDVKQQNQRPKQFTCKLHKRGDSICNLEKKKFLLTLSTRATSETIFSYWFCSRGVTTTNILFCFVFFCVSHHFWFTLYRCKGLEHLIALCNLQFSHGSSLSLFLLFSHSHDNQNRFKMYIKHTSKFCCKLKM